VDRVNTEGGVAVAYLDHAATTPLRPEAAAAMAPYLGERFGNPSGGHQLAREARRAVDEAREVVAALLGFSPGEVVFTSGGTEAANLAVAGVLTAHDGSRAAVCSSIEHPAVLESARAAAGVRVALSPVDDDGVLLVDGLDGLLDDEVALVSVMTANNEVGTVQPLADVVARVRRSAPSAVVHTDAVQAAPWLDLPAVTAGVDLVSVSAHKLGGPKGVGALGVRSGTPLRPLLFGGGQERGLRSGTHDVAGIVGLAAAFQAAVDEQAVEAARVGALRDRLRAGLVERVPGSVATATGRTLLPGHCHFRFDGVEQEELLFVLDAAGICASGGSSCASGALEPSHVLLAMGVGADDARSAVRFTLGRTTTEAEVDRVLSVVPEAVARLRSGSEEVRRAG